MNIFLAVFTYFAYGFIITAYTIKGIKYLNMPVHLRWELYPVIPEANYRYGGSRFENIDWWEKTRHQGRIRGVLYLLKEYLHLGEYFHRHRSYWLFLYPWHAGFILIITFHVLCFFSALAMVSGITVAAGSPDAAGIMLYYGCLLTGVTSFIAGAFGSIGLPFKRRTDPDLRAYATPMTYFSYLFTAVVFLSGLAAWIFTDPTLSEYREFWKGLITFRFIGVEAGSAFHIIAFNLFLIYLPFTRSFHYVARFFAFFLIRWDDEPNIRGGLLEKKLQEMFKQKVTWSAPHVKTGKSWEEAVKNDR
jgi:nitrate reductase gamma subunit